MRVFRPVAAFALALSLAAGAIAHDFNTDKRKASSALDLGSNQRITFSYSALHWHPEIFEGLAKNEQMRTMFNTRRLPGTVTINTPVALTLAETNLPAGDHSGGFFLDDKGAWFFTVNDKEGKSIAKVPLALNKTGDTADHLEVVVLPGSTAQSAAVKIRYGTNIANFEVKYGSPQ